jgi:hypothetical protein
LLIKKFRKSGTRDFCERKNTSGCWYLFEADRKQQGKQENKRDVGGKEKGKGKEKERERKRKI